jgi:hypothetical protein
MVHKFVIIAFFLLITIIDAACFVSIEKGSFLPPDESRSDGSDGIDASEHDAVDAEEYDAGDIEPDCSFDLDMDSGSESLTLDNADNVANWVSSDNTNLVKIQDTSDKKEGTGSIQVAATASNVVSDQTRYSCKDADVRSDNPDRNYGSVTRDDIYEKDAIKKRLFVAFDLSSIDSDATISSAIFHLNLYEVAFGGITAEICGALANWDETTITWANMPSVSSKYCDMSLTDAGWKSVTITSMIQNYINGTYANYGWRVMRGDGLTGENRANVYHREQADCAPRLVLSYTEPKSLNDILTRDLGAGNEKNLSGYRYLKYWIKSTRTGTYLQFGMGETAWNNNTWDVTINSADTWEEKTIDISGIPDVNKDAIRYLGFIVTNADTAFTMKFDNITAE